MDVLGVGKRISISDFLNPADKDDILESVSIQRLASSIVEASVEDGMKKEEEEVSEFSGGEKPKILANARDVLDSNGMMIKGVDRQFWRA